VPLTPLAGLLAILASAVGSSKTPPAPLGTVTILYDAFGENHRLTPDWGFSALVEYAGKRILFDTGNNAEIFEHNVKALGVDLKRLDFAVISHRHGDHIAGLNYLLKVNPKVRIYAPREGFGVFGSAIPGTFLRTDSTLPAKMRYFAGAHPEQLRGGTPWPAANFTWIDSVTQIVPGVTIVSTVSQNPGTLELRELSLAIETPDGLVILVGCSHPGIETILEASRRVDPHVHLIFGGLHLVNTPDPEIARLSVALRDQWKVDFIAPGHCTGEPAFAALLQSFGPRYVYAGLGTAVPIP
jgi:7,8-dihydropterin-6-yl-methyl-4-(beta-D-ribofuranosyl)aminobenzene 5'-phosphate synthase